MNSNHSNGLITNKQDGDICFLQNNSLSIHSCAVDLCRELKMLAKIATIKNKHTCIIDFYGYFDVRLEDSARFYLITEYMNNNNVYDFLVRKVCLL